MPKFLTALSLALPLAFGSVGAMATTYYVSDCKTGAVAGCVEGSDSNSGTSQALPWKTTAKVLARFASMAAGDKILFAKGGSWTNSAMSGLRNLNSSAAHPITFDSYPPDWYSGNAKPRLNETRSNIILFEFTGGSVANGGYVIRNLDLRGGSGTMFNTSGIWIGGLVHDVIIERISTRDFNTGLSCGDGGKNIVLRNSSITHSRFSGIWGGCSDWLVENNTFDHNGYTPDPEAQPLRNHSIYFASPADLTTTGITIRGNTFTNTVQFDGVCQGVVIVAHGLLKDIVIEDNLIDESQNAGPNKGGCWGIAISPAYDYAERMDNVVIRRNRIINVGGIGIELSACRNCIIENNVIVKNDGADSVAIQAPGSTPNTNPDWEPDAAMGKLTIRNNSMYFGNNAGVWGSTGIQISQGSNHVVVNNLMVFSTPHAHNSCFTSDGSFPPLPLSRYAVYDNNLCYRAGNTGRYSMTYATLADAKNAGFDKHGSAANPQLAANPVAGNSYSMALLAASPAIGAGNTSNEAPKDIDNATRDAQPDIGAFEFTNNPSRPGAPVAVHATPLTGQATVSFEPPLKDGRRPITGYTVSSTPAGGKDSQAGTRSLNHTITGLTRGASYTFTVKATNAVGTGPASVPSSSVKIK